MLPQFTHNTVFPAHLLIKLRWVAILGQSLVTLLCAAYFPYNLPLKRISLVILVSLVVNLALSSTRIIPTRYILVDLLYDLGQLTCLLYLTGGLQNPFCPFLLVSIAISAGFCPPHHNVLITLSALAAVAFLFSSPFPLPTSSPQETFQFPLFLRGGVLASLMLSIIFISLFGRSLSRETQKLCQALQDTQKALSREQEMNSLGALAAAAAHELGSPLTIITLILKEWDTEKKFKDKLTPDELTDLALLIEQGERCKKILVSLSRNPRDLDLSSSLSHLPLSACIAQVVERLKLPLSPPITLSRLPSPGEEPLQELSPEFYYGLGNVLQNALEFCKHKVFIEYGWDAHSIQITVQDDGPGFPTGLLDRLGEPYLSRDSGHQNEKPGIHLGLGLFIARTVIEKMGGTLLFTNGSRQAQPAPGACCFIQIPRFNHPFPEQRI